jgi:hypothetical protein
MLAAGLHDGIPADAYHGDPAAAPSLSASIAHTICTKSAAHAYAAHPRLGGGIERDDEQKFSVGTCAHALLLQGDDIAAVVDAPDWRTKAAQEERDAAVGAGLVPLLVGQWERVHAMTEAARVQLAASLVTPEPFTDGKPEQTIVWEEDGVHCRARIDWLRTDLAAIDDYKSTSASADPSRWVRTAYGIGADIQVAMYLRGCERVFGTKPDFRFIVQETYPPYALSVVNLAPSALALADDKVSYAINVWRTCLESGVWPAYDPRVASLETPTYEEMAWLERDGAVS